MKKKIYFIIIAVVIFLISGSPVFADQYNNYNPEGIVSCGKGMIDNIPSLIPKVVSIAYTLIQVAVPVVLVIMGSLDLFKGLSAQKEDDIKKGQQIFVKRLIAAALVFFVFVIVKLVISFVADGTGNKIVECAECFINNDCETTESDRIDIDIIMRSVRQGLNDSENPEYVSYFRQSLISIIGEDFSGDNNSLIEEIEKRLEAGDDDLSEKIINFLYYE